MSHCQRIACLPTEPVDILYALGAEDCIAGISEFTVRPPRAREEKPRISGFSSARFDRILAVRPDLAIGSCSLQADILSPGPSAFMEGLRQLSMRLAQWQALQPEPA
jgi:iron complex transport system substrate-binding protein